MKNCNYERLSMLLYFYITYLVSFPILRCHFEHSTFHSTTVTFCLFTCSVHSCTAECTSPSLGLLHWRTPLPPSSCWGHRSVWSQDAGENILPGLSPHEPILAVRMFQHAEESNTLPVTKSVSVITAALTFQLPCELDALYLNKTRKI